jgi:Phosphotransferase enzyme family
VTAYSKGLRPRAPARPRLPDDRALSAALGNSLSGPVELDERFQHPYVSSWPSEVVRCRVGGRELLVLCKYGIERPRFSHGHRRGVAYEAEIYRLVLARLRLTTPRFFGVTVDECTGSTWLFLEFLEDAIRPDDAEDVVDALSRTARWIARFHLAHAEHATDRTPSFLSLYDLEYYGSWARRAVELTSGTGIGTARLARLCRGFDEVAAELLEEQTVIHGEFTPHNNLMREGRIFPVDWESAAVAAGEIDLASLTDGWPREIAQACEAEYLKVRWPLGQPDGFPRRLEIARMYWHLRWLAKQVRPGRIATPRWRVAQLYELGKRIGIAR